MTFHQIKDFIIIFCRKTNLIRHFKVSLFTHGLNFADDLSDKSFLGKWKKKYKCRINLVEVTDYTVLQNELYDEKGDRL